jgi:uncharacterized membrane protein YhaH (DUF805 family)
MGNDMGWKYLLTDLDGRINRQRYWIGALILIVIGLVLQMVGYMIGGEALAIIFGLTLLYPCFAINVKRAHDRGRPTWLIVVFFAVLILVNVLQLLGLGQTAEGPTTLFLVIAIPWLIFAVYLFIELACLRGTPGANPYGPDPLAGRG